MKGSFNTKQLAINNKDKSNDCYVTKRKREKRKMTANCEKVMEDKEERETMAANLDWRSTCLACIDKRGRGG